MWAAALKPRLGMLAAIAYAAGACIYFGVTAALAWLTATVFSTWWTYVTYQFIYALVWPVALVLQLLGIGR